MATTFTQGQKVGGFVVVTRIGVGQFGETWLCENVITKRKAILKGLKADLVCAQPAFLSGFDLVARSKEEAQIVAALGDRRFQFVPVLYDAFELSDGRVFFLTEYAEGQMLHDWLQSEGSTDRDRALVAVNLLHAVRRLHSVGIIHRDLAGDNIIIGSDGRLKIVDFGIAKIFSEILLRKYSSATVTPFTKLKYMPPKVLAARAKGLATSSDPSWDLYACGVMLFELFSRTILTSPASEITPEAINKLLIPKTITLLLSSGETDNAAGAEQILLTLNQELRLAKLESSLPSDQVDPGVIGSLRSEIEQLRKELDSRRGRTRFEDIVGYLMRMGVAYAVIPKKKVARVDFEQITVRVVALDENVLLIDTPKLRMVTQDLIGILPKINELNRQLNLTKLVVDPDDGEVKLVLQIPHASAEIPFEEFSSLFSLVLSTAVEIGKDLDQLPQLQPSNSPIPTTVGDA